MTLFCKFEATENENVQVVRNRCEKRGGNFQTARLEKKQNPRAQFLQVLIKAKRNFFVTPSIR